MRPKALTPSDIKSLARKNVLEMKPYSSARDEFKGSAGILLDANESPFESRYNRYPDPQQSSLKGKLAKTKSVREEQIFLGNGSDEAIDLLIRIFCEPNQDSILIVEPTYGMYAVCADLNAVNVKTTTLTDSFELDDNRVLAASDETTKLLFLCSPNNPSGNVFDPARVKNILNNFRGIVVIDEAYIDFASTQSHLNVLTQYPNLVILQTFSKAWGLAGIRLGVAYASSAIVSLLNKVKHPYNVSIESQAIATDALDNPERKDICVNEILGEREKVSKELEQLAIVQNVYPSDANFLLVRMKNAASVYENLMSKKIIVRNRSSAPLCENCLRITIGTAEENERLLQALKEL